MTKIESLLAIWGAVTALCAVIARALPPGRAQQAFAFVGSLAAPKPLPPKDGAK